MANKLKVSAPGLEDFLKTGDVSNVVICALDDYYWVILEMLCYIDAKDKDFIFDVIDDLWKQGSKLASRPDAIKKSQNIMDEAHDVSLKIVAYEDDLMSHLPFFKKMCIKLKRNWLRQKQFSLAWVVCYAIINHPEKTKKAKQKVIEYVKQRFDGVV